jgi:NAD(P) transhydrogenase subunit alpha
MAPRSVLVGAAAERGGNCELTEPGKTVVKHGVTIIGPENLPSTLPYHASQMLAKNITTLFEHLTRKEGELIIDLEDEITSQTLLCYSKKIINQRVREVMGLDTRAPDNPA